MLITYLDCKYHDYQEYWDGEEETRVYACTHPKGTGKCRLENWYGDEEECALAEKDDSF